MAGGPKKDGLKATDPIIGIDLGMTSVVAAYVAQHGQPPQVIPGEKGASALPAVVGYRGGKDPVFGRAAQEMLTTAPELTVTGIKRLLGRKTTSQAVKDLSSRVGFKIVDGPEQDVAIRIGDKLITPVDVASVLLGHVRSLAEAHLKEKVHHCVIAVPAYFNDAQKAAVREAAKRAGMEAIKLVHEPTAVALAYGFNKGGDARILILDMGGIRLDVSVMEITGNVFDVVATGGDAYLGGLVIDARLVEWILSNIKKKYGKDLAAEPALLTKVRTAAEQAKRELGKFKAVDLQIPLNIVPKGQKPEVGPLRLNQETIEKLAADVVDRVLSLSKHVLSERGLGFSDVNELIFVGGGTRLPALKNKVAQAFGKEPRSTLPPEEVIAFGAALLGDSLRREAQAQMELLQEPIGIALSDGRFMKIIDKDSRLPITRRVMIPTVRDNQRMLEIDLFQGEDEDILHTEYLGTVVYGHIPEAKAGEAKVMVDLILGADRTLTVASPEPGRDGERFQIPTKDGERKIVPSFTEATAAPAPAKPS